jgi:putative thiamine transport system permease protein
MIRFAALVAGAALWAVPLLLAVAAGLAASLSGEAWTAFLAHPQVPGGTAIALWTGTAGLALALVVAVLIAMALHGTSLWHHMPVLGGAALALPHLAFAIGFGFLIMPSGVIARLVVGGTAPPDWVTTHDPGGLSLIAVLALKETPFLLLLLWSALSQGDSARLIDGQMRVARSLGHGSLSVWLRVVMPQALRRIAWPVLIVWVYGVTVVDLALVIGPTQPSAVAAVVMALLNDADSTANRAGLAGAIMVTVLVALGSASAFAALKMARPLVTGFLTAGPAAARVPRITGGVLLGALAGIYAAVLLVLVLLSVTPRWPYPALLPDVVSLKAWQGLSWHAAGESLQLAGTTSLASVALIVLWFETWARRWDSAVRLPALLALGLPGLVIAAGQYVLLLRLGLTGTQAGLFLVHLTQVLAYAFIVLQGPYRAFDRRLTAVSRSLGASPFRTWAAVKLPLLRAPLATAFAVGFAVSLVQFVPAQLAAAGRFTTLPIEAVTLSAGGNRPLLAVHALALALPAFVAFALAGYLGRARWR